MKILVAVDQSEESQEALRCTCHLLEHFEAKVDALYVQPDVVEMVADSSYAPFATKADVEQAVAAEAEKVLDTILESCEICMGGKIPCTPQIAVGDPTEEILNFAEKGRYELIVLGAHGRSSLRGFLLGTVHSKILHHALQPVLILRNFRPIQKILVAYRGSQCDQGALQFIAPLFAKQKPEITIMHVQETELGESEEFAQACVLTGEDTLREWGYTPIKKVAKGDFVDEILKAVAVQRYDLLVLGAYGHQRPKYLKIISDEALNLVRLTTRPVLVYRDYGSKMISPA
ncbi:universal stress protein [Desulfobacca acetoxidans]|uniref:UspA domain-containing protein n=1 Tax=Desulfobacca acetoxidans (strain ATCC 700848 / DSM 11109 / ASRB2) TaxID=880072 RepID=F2NEX9_DESAR|nr:universal stress protein [Desulfobacca acetoxidans]AEB08319.1 UspA domain-containing protein [Desulfobacca acetoxidans DSM 11109]